MSARIAKALLGTTVGVITATWAMSAQAESVMTRSCRVDQVAVFETRIHVKCVSDPQKAFTQAISYYAMATAKDARVVDNIVALAIAAKQTNKPLVIQFDMDDYKSVPGCQGTNCRRLVSAALE